MKLYNTMGRTIQEFIPYNKNEITMYTCGPTVYNYAHIGNLRTYIFEDILEKTLKYLGYNVKRCMNITDVGHMTSDGDTGEDKMLKGAKEQKMTVYELAQFYTNAFIQDANDLNIQIPEIFEPASKHISDYIEMVEKLLKDGYAYQADGNIYFDITKLDDYYELSSKKEEDLIAAVREDVSVDESKRNVGDFGLWFTKSKFQDQDMKWDSPWGTGYPGWHIECSTLALHYLGDHLDIHCGGVDNIFPHHTNEIAQSEAYLGHKWCNYWIHGDHLLDKSGKMSKSKGEFLTISLLKEKGYDPLSYRFFCLGSHYRKQLVFTYESLDTASTSYQKLLNRIKDLKESKDLGSCDNVKIEQYQNLFKEALEDDLNTANAMTVLYDVLKSDLNPASKLELVKQFDTVLSLDLLKESAVSQELETYILEKIEARNIAKKNKNFEEADRIREELKAEGIVIQDTREGTVYNIIK